MATRQRHGRSGHRGHLPVGWHVELRRDRRLLKSPELSSRQPEGRGLERHMGDGLAECA